MEFETRLQALAGQGSEGVVALVDEIIREGLHRGASDIHVEPAGDRILVRFRLDGVLHPAVEARTDLALNVVARFKVLADLLTYQTGVPQEGRINRDKVGAPADLRVSTFPTVRGEKVVVRLFDPATPAGRRMGLGDLGYPQAMRADLERQLQMPAGVILLTGPAGSGKTTTIYAALQFILDQTRATKNIVTVEDPVECLLPGITQTQVHPASGLTFARCLRSLMRQDPEVIVIGEIRDRETADIAVEAGLTGHLVVSTIHSGTAAGVFTRLLDMRVEPHLVASAVTFAVAQRLVRKLCDKCKRPLDASVLPGAEQAGQPASPAGWVGAFGPTGCDACFQTGYRGRTAIVEALAMADPIREKILQRTATAAFELAARELGMKSLQDAALDAVRRGITSPAEIRRVLGPETLLQA